MLGALAVVVTTNSPPLRPNPHVRRDGPPAIARVVTCVQRHGPRTSCGNFLASAMSQRASATVAVLSVQGGSKPMHLRLPREVKRAFLQRARQQGKTV